MILCLTVGGFNSEDNAMKAKNDIPRRTFIKHGLASALAASCAPHIIPSAAFGSDFRSAPSERTTLGFIGMGMMNSGHLEAFLARDDTQVVAVCDVESTRLEASQSMVDDYYTDLSTSGRYECCRAYRDFRELLACDDIDAVVIATPDHWHALISVAAATAGKDIYCEKPMVHEIAEGRAVVNAARRHGCVFQTGSQQRSDFEGLFRRAAELVRNGVLGELECVEIGVGPPPVEDYELPEERVPETLDWNMWVGPAPWRPYSSTLCPMNLDGWPHWRYYSDFGGGDFSDFGAHHFDIAQWALDMDDSGPVTIVPPDEKSRTRLTYVYGNGVPMYHGAESDVVFTGAKGRILVNRVFIRSEPETLLKTRLGPNDVHLARGCSHHDDWIHCIRTRQKPIADVEVGHRTATICCLGLIAYRLKRALEWDPVTERFVNDEDANRLLARPMRSPWHI
jgi:predicted dehydrogenase